ncbi:GNAT family N-acetyltransferase [Lysobacter capsici]|uniref:GNAT family N-acetyltransferase n=1 Tax=Lysobacter capsici TaxID=435897 RepID=UPI001C00458A|nr:GNAT family N-acetyltransferase [Lysobacter capsici]QWF16142.1 GNAT family N-acetyltransferase [Lysobacter capsici]
MEIRAVSTDAAALASYEQLFQHCFPGASHLNATYLDWLYARNPAGQVIGCDAWEGDTLAAHYVCVPVQAVVAGRPLRVMLSLNTATHPDFQGKGLFTRLADATYQAGAAAGVGAVYGVANANSTPGFIRKLGFTLVRPLDAQIGLGRIDDRDAQAAREQAEFRRDWSQAALAWRVANPQRSYALVRAADGVVGAQASTGKPGLRAWDEVPLPSGMSAPSASPSFGMHLHLGLRPRGGDRKSAMWFDIPQRFRPSPLNMIFRPLGEGVLVPSADSVRLGQLDFDAF